MDKRVRGAARKVRPNDVEMVRRMVRRIVRSPHFEVKDVVMVCHGMAGAIPDHDAILASDGKGNVAQCRRAMRQRAASNRPAILPSPHLPIGVRCATTTSRRIAKQ